MNARTKEIQQEQKQAAELAAKIKAMESKLLVGGQLKLSQQTPHTD
jgi:hypothetical protein